MSRDYTSDYISPPRIGKKPTVPMDAQDPRLQWDSIGPTFARQGAEIAVVDLNGSILPASRSSTLAAANGNGGNGPSGSILGPQPIFIDYKQIYDTIVQPGPNDPTGRPNVLTLGSVVINSISWSGNDLVVNFTFDPTEGDNVYANEFIVHAVATNGSEGYSRAGYFKVNKSSSSQSITFTKAINTETLHGFTVSFSSFCIAAVDTLGINTGGETCVSVPTYTLDLPVPTITVTAVNNGYTVGYTTPTSSSFSVIEIVEYESNSTTEPTGVTYNTVYSNTLNPAVIISPNLNQRWVKARFIGTSNTATDFSAAQKVTPISTISVDLVPPNEVASVSASWSGDDIHISYTLPATDPAVRIQIQLTAPNGLVGYFYRFPDASGTSQSTIIYKKDLFDQFGEHYSSFSGILKSIDSADNRSSGVSFNVATRANPLTGITPTFTITALSNAYSVSTTFPTGAAFFEVYAKHSAWLANPTDETYLVYSGSSPAVIIDSDYTAIYVKIRYYDDFNNTSSFSTQSNNSTTPLDPGVITSFENPISFGSNAVIYAGSSYNSGTRTLFKAGGIFAYDATNVSPSTQIVSNASAGTPTFITTQAQIADWNVTSTKIENTLSGAPTAYTGLSATGTYSFWAGSPVTGGNSSAKFTVTPAGAVTAREIYIVGTGDANSKLIDAGGNFYVKHDGTMYAAAAEITGKLHVSGGSSLDGNVTVGSSASITSGTVGAGSGNAGYILNTAGLRFDNGSTQGITQIVASTGKLITSSASIGGWNVDSSSISKTNSSGTLTLDSSNAYIKASSANYSAGVNTPTSNSSSNITFWSGAVLSPSTSASFYVTADGTMNAAKANITGGIINATGSLGKIVIDADHQFIQFGNSGNTYNAYLMPRAVQGGTALILTGTTPFVGGSPYSYAVTDDLLNAHPYLSIGPTTNSFGKIMEGIGLYTTNAYINVTESNGIGISTVNNLSGSTYYANQILLSSGSLKLNSGTTTISNGVETNTKISSQMLVDSKTITLQTWTTDNVSTPTAGSQIVLGQGVVTIGARSSASGTGKIIVSDKYVTTQVSSSNFIVVGDISSQISSGSIDGSGVGNSGQTIVLQASNSRVNGVSSTSGTDGTNTYTSAYSGPSRIVLDSQYGVGIWGLPVQGNITIAKNTNTGYYMDTYPLGPYARQRMLVEDPATGQTKLGMAVYYSSSTEYNSAPTNSSGYVGDLWVIY